MKLASFLIIVCLANFIGPSCCFWGKLRAKLKTSAIESSSSKFSLLHRVGRPEDEFTFDEKPADDDAAGSLEVETTVIDGTSEEERLFNKYPLHVFMKKKKPFVELSTTTKTSTVTAIITLSTVGLCAQLVNVTGPCRMRKGLWVREPIVMSFDDDMDSIDGALTPTKTVGIEATTKPEEIPDVIQERETSTTGPPSSTSQRISARSGSLIQSSKEDVEFKQEMDDDDEEQVEEGRFGYFGLKKKFKKKIKFITVVTTTAVTTTSTSTSYVTISTKTFFIQICTPSPFPFSVCSGGKKRRDIEFEAQRSVTERINSKGNLTVI
ncbi:hypothetical protein GHT06_010931 [Daphnia sinensis]|uniref:Uncharacterized protein n=1 Tax=Daphnia sinensis TaxID=1820382 RepID=A0AAD5LJJ0_9CRUS|nr:hypothetical protein GHT06_010931 [Daphnia sinensis]